MIDEPMYKLIDDHDFLSESYIPSRLFGREPQLNDLHFCLSAATAGKKPINAWVYGRPGTGKTVTCRYVLRTVLKEFPAHGVYINCWEHPTFFSVLDKMIRDFRVMGAEKLHSSFKLERLQAHLKGKPLIVFLDEIDQPINKERENILYNFLNMQNIGIVAICNDKHVLYGLDDRIKSRLNAQWIEFTPYEKDDIINILEQRATLALNNGTYKKSVLRHIAEIADQDARIAIQTLKNAVYKAEKEVAKSISRLHVEHGFMTAKNLKKTYLLHKLTQHHRILFELIRGRQEILSGQLWRLYLRNCKKLDIAPIALRTYSGYISKLIDIGLIESERALVKGKVRNFKAVE